MGLALESLDSEKISIETVAKRFRYGFTPENT
jgi:hypothetical protein